MNRKQRLANAIGIVLIVLSVAALAYSVLNPPTNPSSAPPLPQPSVTLTDERWQCKYDDFGSRRAYFMVVDFNLTETNGVDAAVVVATEIRDEGGNRVLGGGKSGLQIVLAYRTESGGFVTEYLSQCYSNHVVEVISVKRV